MKALFEPLFIALSMYSIVPVPMTEWNDKNVKRALVFFPVVGILCAVVLCFVCFICKRFSASPFFSGTMCTLAVLFLTGGIHADGFCDTADALFSRRGREEKLRIMKDPNCGSFAVICAVSVLLMQCASYSQIIASRETMAVMCIVFVMSRALGGLSLVSNAIAPSSSLARIFGENAPRYAKWVMAAEYAIAAFLGCYVSLPLGAAAVAVTLSLYIRCCASAKKNFGGVTGDTAGFFLVLCETLTAAAIALLSGGM